jgi:hypothetical protein
MTRSSIIQSAPLVSLVSCETALPASIESSKVTKKIGQLIRSGVVGALGGYAIYGIVRLIDKTGYVSELKGNFLKPLPYVL